MASLILYSLPDTHELIGPEYWGVWIGNTRVFVRGELHDGDVSAALSAANPREGEIVLNSIPAE